MPNALSNPFFPYTTSYVASPEYLSQAINPWSWWSNAMGQWGLININLKSSRDPATERAIVENVASYGRQLGRISAVLMAIIENKGDLHNLSVQEKAAILDFQDMTTRIETVKKSYKKSMSRESIEDFLDNLANLRTAEPRRYEQIVDKIKEIVGDLK